MDSIFAFMIVALVFVDYSDTICYDFIYEHQKISPRAGLTNSKYFGNSLLLSNGFLVVGSKHDPGGGVNAGAAHIYAADADGLWIHHSKLVPSGIRPYAQCGSTLAAHGNTLLLGCPGIGVLFFHKKYTTKK